MIEELTSKLKECTKAMQQLKNQNKKLKEDLNYARKTVNETVEI